MTLETIIAGMKNGTLDPKALVMNMLNGRNINEDMIKGFAEFAKAQGATEADIQSIINSLTKK